MQVSAKTADFDYVLPPELIAQQPAARRDGSGMLVVHRRARRLEHRAFSDLATYLGKGDLLVVNNTRVLPARIDARKAATGGRVEVLALEPLDPQTWVVLLRASRRPAVGERLLLRGAEAEVTALGEQGRATLRVVDGKTLEAVLRESGRMPLPPYIKRTHGDATGDAEDRERYQTLFAQVEGAVAAPTAGLHFTKDVLRRLEEQGVETTRVTLHVGPGTFRPVKAEAIADHHMEEERFVVTGEAAEAITRTRSQGGRIVAVGSTVTRVLETVAAEHGRIVPCEGRTSLFIRPPYTPRMVDVMLTNFHLPRSTLLMMVCALADHELIMRAYREAVRMRYRFYSYGDCMLLI